METAIKLLIVLLSAPLWYRPIKLILAEISRVVQLPEADAAPERLTGNRNVKAGKAFREISVSAARVWNRDDGRISNARWATGRRSTNTQTSRIGGHGFPTRRKRTGLSANQTRFGSGGWQGGFGRR
ncbi:MAG: hypothetical protein ACI8QS_000865 [Planctomycetota bacterium]|jgi:hypothetical protein